MKKLLLLISVALAVLVAVFVLGYLGDLSDLSNLKNKSVSPRPKTEILKIALVADSHNENDLLENALREAQGKGINFVIGLGDYTNLGTVEELVAAKREFDRSGLQYYLVPGDRDGWDNRRRGEANTANFEKTFGHLTRDIKIKGIQFVLLDNSDIYSGISAEDWASLTSDLGHLSNFSDLSQKGLVFVFAHKTPFHPESRHVMGEDSLMVAEQAKVMVDLMENTHSCHSEFSSESSGKKILKPLDLTQGKRVQDDKSVQDDKLCPAVDGFFSGDIHFFAKYQSPSGSVKITTIGAVASERNFQGPRFAILTIWDDYSWEVEDVEIR